MTTTAQAEDTSVCEGQHSLEPLRYKGANKRHPATHVVMICPGCSGSIRLDVEDEPDAVRVLTYP